MKPTSSLKLSTVLLKQLNLSRNWFYIALTITLLIGWLAPGVGCQLSRTGITPWLVAFAFFLNGFTLSTESLRENAHRWYIALPAILITFVISPALVLLARMLLPGGHSALADGFQLVAAAPTMLVSAVIITRMATGNTTVALYLTVVNNLLAILIVPPLLFVTLQLGGVNLRDVSMNLLLTVLLPTIVGQLANRRWQHVALAHARLIGIVSQFSILVFLLLGAVQVPHTRVAPTLLLLIVFACLAHHLFLLLLGDMAGRLLRCDSPTRHALAFCSAQKSIAIITLLVQSLFVPLGPAFGIAALPGIIYYVTELIFDSLLAQWWARKSLVSSEQ